MDDADELRAQMAKRERWQEIAIRNGGCSEPDSTWGVCGVTEELHEVAFRDLAGTRFWHGFRAQQPVPGAPEGGE